MDNLDRFTQAYLQERFVCDADQGVLYWRPIPEPTHWQKIWNIRFAGKEAGMLHYTGYKSIHLCKCHIAVHRIIWKMVHGFAPPEMDHIDRDPSNNRIANLRVATTSENCRNRGARSDSTSGHAGVCWDKDHNKWSAYLYTGGKRLHLGRYFSKDKAISIRREAENVHFKEFAPHHKDV